MFIWLYTKRARIIRTNKISSRTILSFTANYTSLFINIFLWFIWSHRSNEPTLKPDVTNLYKVNMALSVRTVAGRIEVEWNARPQTASVETGVLRFDEEAGVVSPPRPLTDGSRAA